VTDQRRLGAIQPWRAKRQVCRPVNPRQLRDPVPARDVPGMLARLQLRQL